MLRAVSVVSEIISSCSCTTAAAASDLIKISTSPADRTVCVPLDPFYGHRSRQHRRSCDALLAPEQEIAHELLHQTTGTRRFVPLLNLHFATNPRR